MILKKDQAQLYMISQARVITVLLRPAPAAIKKAKSAGAMILTERIQPFPSLNFLIVLCKAVLQFPLGLSLIALVKQQEESLIKLETLMGLTVFILSYLHLVAALGILEVICP